MDILNIVMLIITAAMFAFAVYSFKRTLKESWQNSVIIAASDFMGASESLRMEERMEKISKKESGDSKLLGDIISAIKRLEMLLVNREKHNIFDLAEELKDLADNGESISKYKKKEDEFKEMIILISDLNTR